MHRSNFLSASGSAKEKAKMKVLFIGGTGNINSACTQLAADKGHEVLIVNRRRNPYAAVPEGVTVLTGDVRDRNRMEQLVRPHHFDAVVNFQAFEVEHIEADLQLFHNRTSQYVMISTASAYQKPPVDYLIKESTPLHNPYWRYSQKKIACELRLMQAYREQGFPVTIVRPSYTYGHTWIPCAVGGRDYTVVRRMRQGKGIIVHGDGQSLWTMTHSSDFAKGLVGLLGSVQAIGESFHITSDEVLTWDQIYQVMGQAAGVAPKLVHISAEFISAFAPAWGEFLFGDKACSMVFDNSKIRRVVPEFKATISFAQGIKRSIQWFDADKNRQITNPQTDALIDRIIAAHESALP
jgi:nucleoside-diphosphate-sugar epimerase